eukprot:1158370-Pelagomonas_calceolata.AAC.2
MSAGRKDGLWICSKNSSQRCGKDVGAPETECGKTIGAFMQLGDSKDSTVKQCQKKSTSPQPSPRCSAACAPCRALRSNPDFATPPGKIPGSATQENIRVVD